MIKIKEIKKENFGAELIIDEHGDKYEYVDTDDTYSIYQGTEKAVEWTINSDFIAEHENGDKFKANNTHYVVSANEWVDIGQRLDELAAAICQRCIEDKINPQNKDRQKYDSILEHEVESQWKLDHIELDDDLVYDLNEMVVSLMKKQNGGKE